MTCIKPLWIIAVIHHPSGSSFTVGWTGWILFPRRGPMRSWCGHQQPSKVGRFFDPTRRTRDIIETSKKRELFSPRSLLMMYDYDTCIHICIHRYFFSFLFCSCILLLAKPLPEFQMLKVSFNFQRNKLRGMPWWASTGVNRWLNPFNIFKAMWSAPYFSSPISGNSRLFCSMSGKPKQIVRRCLFSFSFFLVRFYKKTRGAHWSVFERSKALNHTAVRKIIKKFDKRFHVGLGWSRIQNKVTWFLLDRAHWNKPFEAKVHFQEVIPTPVMSPGTRRPGLHSHGWSRVRSSIHIYTILHNSLYFYGSNSIIIKVYERL